MEYVFVVSVISDMSFLRSAFKLEMLWLIFIADLNYESINIHDRKWLGLCVLFDRTTDSVVVFLLGHGNAIIWLNNLLNGACFPNWRFNYVH